MAVLGGVLRTATSFRVGGGALATAACQRLAAGGARQTTTKALDVSRTATTRRICSSTRSERNKMVLSATSSTRLFGSSGDSGRASEAVVSPTTAATATTTTSTSTKSSATESTSSLRRTKIVHLSPSSSPQSSWLGQTVTIQGWVRTIRKQKTLAFIQINDGSDLAGIQVIADLVAAKQPDNDTSSVVTTALSSESLQAVLDITTGAAVSITGTVVASPKNPHVYEVAATHAQLLGPCPADTYPLAKKRHSLEYLRTLAHLRPRTNTIAAVARVRSRLAGAIHHYFQTQGFVYVQTPLITASDCEGAGELFRVTTLPLQEDISKLPMKKQSKSSSSSSSTESSSNSNNMLDFSQDFFGKPAFLTVSGQLGAETYACALGDVYTFGPTFRAENSQTTRHLAEFHMVEPEMAFCDLFQAMENAEQMLQSVIRHVLDHCRPDLEFFQKFYKDDLIERLEGVVSKPFARVSYRQAIDYLQQEIAKDPSKWQFPDVSFGTDLATEHERWLAEQKFGGGAVFVYNYPKSIKAFYMRDNDEDDGETVHAMDLLVPGVGELIGGSQREDRLDKLITKMNDLQLNPDDYWWYLDLRRYGSVPHAGYGLGFERLVTYVCGIENIREAIAFPRYPGNAEF